MKKLVRRVSICMLIALFFWCGTLLSDRQRLRQELIRFHVVANSDAAQDQYLKLRVRDAVIRSLQEDLGRITDMEQARAYLQEKLPYIQRVATKTLRNLGCGESVAVSLCREAFDTRQYDTFSLPAGMYEALRIVIGQGQGQNWWCVVFPSFCLGAASESVEEVAAGAGFSQPLQGAITGQEEYELRFAVLDAMGKLENCLFGK